MLQALLLLKALKWESISDRSGRSHAELESLRQAWKDRLTLLGDPGKTDARFDHLLSPAYASQTADRIKAIVKKQGRPAGLARPVEHHGTVHLSAVDRWGNMVALTLTHGNSFGARVAVPGLGLILGHGMSRFNAEPGHPNSVASGKRPLHNMCPSIVYRDNRAVLAVGGAGGRRIPNAVFAVLKNYCLLQEPIESAIAGARLHTEGGDAVFVERHWPAKEAEYFSQIGYKVQRGSVALVSAVAWDPVNHGFKAAQR